MSQTARLLNIKQYSNIILFEKRAHDFKFKKKSLFQSKIKKNRKLKSAIFLKTNKNSSFSFPVVSNSLFSDLTTKISTRIKLLENSLSELKNKPDLKQSQNENKKSIDNYGNKNKTFLTDSIKINEYMKKSAISDYNNIKQKKSLSTIKDSLNKTFLSSNNSNLLINNDFSKINNANILLFFQKEKNNKVSNNNLNNKKKNSSSSDKFKKMIECKIKSINPNKIDLNSYIEETRNFNLNKYSNLMKKENYKICKENIANILEYYKDKYINLERKKKLLNIHFIEKMGDYVKFINSQKEKEKAKNTNLINIIIEIKNEIKQLNKNIAKKIQYKKNILRWIYLQIQLKEKKIKLPSYYRTILESNEIKKSNNSIENKNNEEINVSKKNQRKHYSIEIRTTKKHLTRKKQKKIQEIEFNSENGLFYNHEIDLNNPANILEIFKIKNYKKTPIYNTVEELNDIFIFYDNKNITLMNYYYNLRKEIYYLNIELLNIRQKIKENEIYNNNTMKIKEKEFNKINESFINNNNLNQELNKIKYKDNIISHYLNQNSFNLKLNKNKKQDDDKMCLLTKVNNLFNTCKSSGIESNFELLSQKKDKKRNANYYLDEILFKLKYITFTIDYLISKFKYYNSGDYGQNQLLIRLKNEIEKEHKNKKADEQKMLIQKKVNKLRKKLEERNNKIYFLPYKKIDIIKNKRDSKKRNKSFENKKIKKITFDDLLDDN